MSSISVSWRDRSWKIYIESLYLSSPQTPSELYIMQVTPWLHCMYTYMVPVVCCASVGQLYIYRVHADTSLDAPVDLRGHMVQPFITITTIISPDNIIQYSSFLIEMLSNLYMNNKVFCHWLVVFCIKMFPFGVLSLYHTTICTTSKLFPKASVQAALKYYWTYLI